MKVDLNGDFVVTAAPDETFDFITSPNTFAPILPYFKDLHSVEKDSFVVILEVGVPQIRGRAEVKAHRIEAIPGERVVYKISGRHALGMIDARMNFCLSPIDGGTKVVWSSEGTVSGTLASLAQGIMLPLARRQIKSLVASVQEQLGAPQEEPKPSGLIKRTATSARGLFGAKKPAASEGQS